MKNISLIISFLTCLLIPNLLLAQQEAKVATSFSDLEAGMPLQSQNQSYAPPTITPQPEGITNTYSDRTAFQAACAGLTLEDFNTLAVSPSGVVGCGNPVNSANSCGGTLVGGFSYAASTGTVVALGAGTFGPSTPTPLIAANLFAAFNIIIL